MAEQLNELQRWHQAMLGRKQRVLEIKREANELLVNELLARTGEPPRFPSADSVASQTPAGRKGGDL